MTETMGAARAGSVAGRSLYATILVHAEPDESCANRIEAAARLAKAFGARLIGLGAETFDAALVAGPFGIMSGGQLAGLVQDQLDANLTAAETAFRKHAAGADIEWRHVRDHPHQALINAAYAADIIVVSPRSRKDVLQAADPADVMMGAGRPILVVPEGRSELRSKAVVVAWKDSRECRRAITDALPLLQRAESVLLASVVKPGGADAANVMTADVVANLERHSVAARAVVSVSIDPVELEIDKIAKTAGADLIIAGGFGHSRLREWALGGVTDSLLRHPPRFVMMSH